MPNALAQIMILAWPVLTVVLFLRLPAGRAIVASLFIGMLVLPTRVVYDLPLLPALDRSTAPVLSSLLCCLLAIGARGGAAARRSEGGVEHRPGWLPQSPVQRLLVFGMVFQPVITSLLNGDTVVYGARVFPGLGVYDALSNVLEHLVTLIPLLLGRRYLSRAEDVELLLRFMVGTMLIYSIPILLEIRISPQIHYWVYGFRPTDFIQAVRGGGFRPMVLMNHGLPLAMAMALTIIAATGLARSAPPLKRTLARAKAGWLAMVLLLSNSLGALMGAAFAVPFVAFTKRPFQATVAMALGVMVLIYPLSRAYDIFPADEMASTIGGVRGGSLQFRFDNEDILLDKALERPVFGWGSWGRNRVIDSATGQDISVTDGAWIITIGTGGMVGFLTRFGLLASPLLLLWRYRKREDMGQETVTLAMMVAINLVDLLPNSTMWPLLWLCVGSLSGRYEVLRSETRATVAAATPGGRRRPAVALTRKRPADPAPPAARPPEAEPPAKPEPRGAVRPGLGGAARRRGAPPMRRQ